MCTYVSIWTPSMYLLEKNFGSKPKVLKNFLSAYIWTNKFTVLYFGLKYQILLELQFFKNYKHWIDIPKFKVKITNLKLINDEFSA